MSSIFDRIVETVETGRTGRQSHIAEDRRADDRRRSVLLSRDRVTIDRHFRGIAMRLSVPMSSYRGVCVGVRTAETGGFVYELRLAHPDPDLSVVLAEAPDEHSIWADWRHSAGFFGLPALIERNDGPEPWGAFGACEGFGRRVKRRRRPGIVARRAVTPGAMATVHREDEIIART